MSRLFNKSGEKFTSNTESSGFSGRKGFETDGYVGTGWEYSSSKASFGGGWLAKFLTLALAAFITSIIQNGFFLNFRPFGSAPDLCLALVVAVAIKGDAKDGSLIGLFAGFFLDCFSKSGLSLLIPFYLLLGTVIGLISEGKNLKGLPIFAFVTLVAAFARGLLSFFEACLTLSSFNVWLLIGKSVAPYIFVTVLFCPVVYFVAWLYRNLFFRGRKSAKK